MTRGVQLLVVNESVLDSFTYSTGGCSSRADNVDDCLLTFRTSVLAFSSAVKQLIISRDEAAPRVGVKTIYIQVLFKPFYLALLVFFMYISFLL